MISRLYTVPEIAKMLRMSRSGVMNLIRRGEIPVVEVPSVNPRRAGRLLIKEETLSELLERWENHGN